MNPIWEIFYIIPDYYPSNCQGHQIREVWELSQPRGDVTIKHNVGSGWDPGTENDIS